MMRATLSLLAVALSTGAFAADKQVEDLLSQMRDAYKAIHAVAFTSESHFGDTVFVNNFVVSNPSKIRLEIVDPKGSTEKEKLIKASDGENIRFKLPGTSEYTKDSFTLDKFENNLPANLESFCFFDFERQLSTAPGKNMEKSTFEIQTDRKWNGKNWTVLVETAKAQGVICSYYVDPKSHLIWRVVSKTVAKPDEVAGEFFLKKLDTSVKIDPAVFRPS